MLKTVITFGLKPRANAQGLSRAQLERLAALTASMYPTVSVACDEESITFTSRTEQRLDMVVFLYSARQPLVRQPLGWRMLGDQLSNCVEAYAWILLLAEQGEQLTFWRSGRLADDVQALDCGRLRGNLTPSVARVLAAYGVEQGYSVENLVQQEPQGSMGE